MTLERGLYEQLLTEALAAQLPRSGERVVPPRRGLHQAEAAGRSDERAFSFLGPATYEKHEREMPMAVAWRLSYPLPGDLFSSFAAAVA